MIHLALAQSRLFSFSKGVTILIALVFVLTVVNNLRVKFRAVQREKMLAAAKLARSDSELLQESKRSSIIQMADVSGLASVTDDQDSA